MAITAGARISSFFYVTGRGRRGKGLPKTISMILISNTPQFMNITSIVTKQKEEKMVPG